MAPMRPLENAHIREALATVQDPDLGKDLVTLGMVKAVAIDGANIHVTIELTTPACPMKDRIKQDIETAIGRVAEERNAALEAIEVEFTAQVRPANEALREEASPLPNVKHVIAVGAGKGGVGKSTVAVSLALGLARTGAKVGLLDGDIYGPSIPTMLGLDDEIPKVNGATLLPFEVHSIKAVSIGKLVDPDKALIWRGPMAHGAFKQLALQTDWGQLDYLLVDLPPGTGDVPLTLAQLLPLTGSVLVCTPQRVAQEDARRAARMFQQLGVDILGVVENMSSFTADDGTEYDLFGRGGAEILARTMGLPFLGNLPLYPLLRKNLDQGEPQRSWEDEGLAKALDGLAGQLASRISIAAMAGTSAPPSLEIR